MILCPFSNQAELDRNGCLDKLWASSPGKCRSRVCWMCYWIQPTSSHIQPSSIYLTSWTDTQQLRQQSTQVGANRPALGPGPLHAALVRQHCLRGTAGWGCTSRPVASLAWGAGVSALAYVAGSRCTHAQQSVEQGETNFTNGQFLPLTAIVKLALPHKSPLNHCLSFCCLAC